jgi:hypothetical protein
MNDKLKNELKNDMKLNRADRRRVEKRVSKETGKSKDDIDVQDVIRSFSEKRKKSNRRYKK